MMQIIAGYVPGTKACRERRANLISGIDPDRLP